MKISVFANGFDSLRSIYNEILKIENSFGRST